MVERRESTVRLRAWLERWRVLWRNRRSGQLSSETVLSDAQSVVLRAAALLRAGVPTARVWRTLGDEADASAECISIAKRLETNSDTAAALASLQAAPWSVLAAVWRVADLSGAPFADVLERMHLAFASLSRLSERRSVLLSGPRATIRLVSALPVIALLLGAALGFDPLGILLSPAGVLLGVTGGVLLSFGVWWATKLTQRLADADWIAGFEFELCWVSLSGGATHSDALRRVIDSVDEAGAHWVRLAELRRDGAVQQALKSAAALGTPVGPALLAEADAARQVALAELERRAERLGVHVLLPIGLCVLPAFIILGVLPVLFAVMGTLAM